MLDGFQESFREEAYELLNNLEQALLELEDRPDDVDLVSAVFRSMHTIKGSASMFGFDEISEFTHHVETMLDDVRNGRLGVSRQLIDLTLESRDHIRGMLEEPDDPSIPKRFENDLKLPETNVQRSERSKNNLKQDMVLSDAKTSLPAPGCCPKL